MFENSTRPVAKIGDDINDGAARRFGQQAHVHDLVEVRLRAAEQPVNFRFGWSEAETQTELLSASLQTNREKHS
jgi:hypothetical protein